MSTLIIYRAVNGILLLDKPCGYSSNNILQKVKKIFCAKKAGHTGSLDPIASGMLPICFGEATKIAQYLLNSNKTYHVIFKLGQSTSTFDSEGKVLLIRKINVNDQKIKKVLDQFTGYTYQIPPMYSAIKYNGKPLYFYARKNIVINRKKRLIHISNIQYINYKNNLIELKISCSKGTYIRSLIHDIGEKLKCGAHIIFLRRLKIAHYTESDLINFNSIQTLKNNFKNFVSPSVFYKKIDQFLISIDTVLSHLNEIILNYEEEILFKNGNNVLLKKNNLVNGIIRVKSKKKKTLIGIGFIKNKTVLFPKRIIF
ncbi:tRNA pseudouridine(55) synthase TruB [Buchnera aphidicola]|uniref:tRNA pseudouridine synthase B n=1 Tax=Buchnera aphidicola (Anoecia oenotherae) TaxID=1241833 RepID=A0A4D6XY58_9GAMM|nr:tRNA pseudouridine(55) synthase TruB [Buchnera aphidicola]QCI19414.1 tRNA pseudouridine(55) synthase TruB [Buchnera aphidicola (Anoecia oenotherae)]